jgi:predicted nucleic acid-binding protein
VERTGDGRILVVADTSFLVNFLAINRLNILHGLRHYAFRIPNHVIAEVSYEGEVERLQAALAAGTVTEIEITDLVEIGLYDELRRGGRLGDGESACLAVAATRRWAIAADEKGRLRREIVERLGEDYLLDTPGALVAALRAGILTVPEAEAIREELARHRFAMKDVPPFEDLLRQTP